jgi:four helix bundle protein
MLNNKIQMANEMTNNQCFNDKKANRTFDLEERTLALAKSCIDLCKLIQTDVFNYELIRQLIRSASSVGANYREAYESITRKDFNHRISICRRESKEAKYWLELLSHTNPLFSDKAAPLLDESLQLTRIFARINRNMG